MNDSISTNKGVGTRMPCILLMCGGSYLFDARVPCQSLCQRYKMFVRQKTSAKVQFLETKVLSEQLGERTGMQHGQAAEHLAKPNSVRKRSGYVPHIRYFIRHTAFLSTKLERGTRVATYRRIDTAIKVSARELGRYLWHSDANPSVSHCVLWNEVILEKLSKHSSRVR